MALASLGGEVWPSTSSDAIGVIEPSSDGRVDFQIRTPHVVYALRVTPDEFEPGGAIDHVRRAWNLGPLVRTPLGDGGAELFAATHSGAAVPSVDRLRALAARVDAVSLAGEPVDALDDRLSRSICAMSSASCRPSRASRSSTTSRFSGCTRTAGAASAATRSARRTAGRCPR